MRVLPRMGAVVSTAEAPWWSVRFPAEVHEPTLAWLRDLAACDVSQGTLRSYGYDLLRWLRFLHVSGVPWERAERIHVRALVEFLRETPNPARTGRSQSAPALGSLNPVTGKAYPGARYAPRTINHQLTVLHGFYAFAVDFDLGPLVNPVPAQRARDGGRPHGHQSPLEPVRLLPRAAYRQRVPRTAPRSIPDDAVDRLLAALTCNRDRALVAFYLSSGVRASELLGLRLERIDYGRRTITVVSKGSRSLDEVPASADAFVWLALYLAELGGPPAVEGPVWWTRRSPRRPFTYHAARAVLGRANALLGTNYSLLSRPGARFRCCHRPVSPDRSPNPPCRSLGNGLSTVTAVRRGSWWAMGLGSCCPGRCSGRPSHPRRSGSTRPRPPRSATARQGRVGDGGVDPNSSRAWPAACGRVSTR